MKLGTASSGSSKMLCVCVCEREREREGEKEIVYVQSERASERAKVRDREFWGFVYKLRQHWPALGL